MKWLIGIDEAGRGPLAGPVAVGVVVVPVGFEWTVLPGVGDSKKIRPEKREEIFRQATALRRSGILNYVVVQSSAKAIDTVGIVGAVNVAMGKALLKLQLDPKDCEVRLDGSLHAPSVFLNQKTIIRGDDSEPVIGLASIMAKVTRDRHMTRMGMKPEFAPYDLALHKGYGTKKHRELIKIHGLSDIHRMSFCRAFQTVS
jgi:ribonuclease HII